MELRTKASRSDAVTQREKENLQVAYRAACEGVVLLKNDGALPLKNKTVALYGPGASMTIKGGTGSGEVNERHSVTILEGLKDRGFTIATEAWIADFERFYTEAEAAYKIEKRKRLNLLKLNEIMQMLFDNFRIPAGPAITDEYLTADTDSCIYVLSRQAGEGGDRKLEKGDYLLTDQEAADIRTCAAHYEKFVLVINCGSSMDLSALDGIGGINAILYMGQLGTEGGSALADILSGTVNPSGRLADTWAYRYEDFPFAMEYGSLNGDLQNENYNEGIFVGYRWFDSFGITPRYPFGFGLSYTSFNIQCAETCVEGTQLRMKALVTNTGSRSGREVAQLYLSAPEEGMTREYQSLAAFGKTRELAPGESETLELRFDLRELASYREQDGAYVLEAGEYVLRLGSSSRNTEPAAVLYLKNEVIVSRHDHICPLMQPMEELHAPARPREVLPASLPRITLDEKTFVPVAYTYEERPIYPDERTRAFVEKLTDAEMADIVVGIGMFGGEKKFDLPGSVGNTTSKFWDRGLANVALCDGPAGLRIQKHSTVTKNGKIKPVEMALSIFESAPDFVKKLITGNPEKEQSLYQFTTAFPVTAALAQTWNVPLMEEVGQAIYREMKEYGCTYWLAPAVNIHRNPLCGRNFEYYSEDPRLTGLLAAAVTRGVQSEPGFYVTVKHFACNNQEDNRNYVSSNVSERALREIYLRAFEYPVRQGGARGIMTSYNRLNGCYTSNSHDLCTKVLRNEWGFEGVVMTDWFSTNKGQASSALAIAAGNDLIMPGGGSFKKDILAGLTDGRLRREDLRRCCANVVASIFDSQTQKEYIG
ncbi:MAG: glycoside hydrolase family 3 C-terminal domain-containing protein [Oscillospiraceae bacterium]|nr:glycoside hydrolase family 3 C-terminal domain-containing protein [Oscillospiraceae bacterium]